MIKLLINLIKGVLIGTSFLIPGMSGGTMMILLDVFDDAIKSVGELLKGRNYKLLNMAEILIGIVAGIVLFSPGLTYLLGHHRLLTICFFLGVIAAGMIKLFRMTWPVKPLKTSLLCFLIGIVMVILINLLPSSLFNLAVLGGFERMIVLFAVGLFLAFAFIAPGISTSYLLLIFGLYEALLMAVEQFDLTFLLPLLLGMIVGVVLFTSMIEMVLRKYPKQTYMMILGFICASLVEIVQFVQEIQSPESIGLGIAVGIVGFALIGVIQILTKKEKKSEERFTEQD